MGREEGLLGQEGEEEGERQQRRRQRLREAEEEGGAAEEEGARGEGGEEGGRVHRACQTFRRTCRHRWWRRDAKA